MTDFIEEKVLLDVLAGQHDRARELVSSMLRSERIALAEACSTVETIIGEVNLAEAGLG